MFESSSVFMMASGVELAARRLALAMDLTEDYLAKNNIDNLALGDQGVIDICVKRAQEIRRDVDGVH